MESYSQMYKVFGLGKVKQKYIVIETLMAGCETALKLHRLLFKSCKNSRHFLVKNYNLIQNMIASSGCYGFSDFKTINFSHGEDNGLLNSELYLIVNKTQYRKLQVTLNQLSHFDLLISYKKRNPFVEISRLMIRTKDMDKQKWLQFGADYLSQLQVIAKINNLLEFLQPLKNIETLDLDFTDFPQKNVSPDQLQIYEKAIMFKNLSNLKSLTCRAIKPYFLKYIGKLFSGIENFYLRTTDDAFELKDLDSLQIKNLHLGKVSLNQQKIQQLKALQIQGISFNFIASLELLDQLSGQFKIIENNNELEVFCAERVFFQKNNLVDALNLPFKRKLIKIDTTWDQQINTAGKIVKYTEQLRVQVAAGINSKNIEYLNWKQPHRGLEPLFVNLRTLEIKIPLESYQQPYLGELDREFKFNNLEKLSFTAPVQIGASKSNLGFLMCLVRASVDTLKEIDFCLEFSSRYRDDENLDEFTNILDFMPKDKIDSISFRSTQRAGWLKKDPIFQRFGEFIYASRLELTFDEGSQSEFDNMIEIMFKPMKNLKYIGLSTRNQQFNTEKFIEYLGQRKNILELRTNIRLDMALLSNVLKGRTNTLRLINRVLLDVEEVIKLQVQFPQHEFDVTFKKRKKQGFNDLQEIFHKAVSEHKQDAQF